MTKDTPEVKALIAAWHTSHRVTVYLVEKLPLELWPKTVPGNTRRTVGSIAAHIHNVRCSWTKMLAARHGIEVPLRVDGRKVTQKELARALGKSNTAIVSLIRFGAEQGGALPPASWQNFPTDLAHFVSYFVAHEAHHRGQLVMLARQLGHRLPTEVVGGLWQWKKRSKE